MYYKKQDWNAVPIAQFADLRADEDGKLAPAVDALAEELGLSDIAGWLLPQLIAEIKNWTLVKNDKGLYCPRLFAKRNIQDSTRVGIWRLCTIASRSKLVPKQSDPVFINYSLLVPLIMSAFKQYNNIPYSAWDREYFKDLNHWQLADAILAGKPTIEDPVLLRQQCLTYKSGAKAGQMAPVLSTWRILSAKNTPFEGYPALTGTMMLQLWVAHPSLRTSLMILDQDNWDVMPEPIILEDLVPKEKKKVVKVTHTESDLPWL